MCLESKRSKAILVFSSLDMTIDELSALQLYGVALVGYFKIEQQLQRHSIPFAHVGPFTSAPSPPSPAPATPAAKADVTIEVPSLCLHARNLVEGAQDFVHQNVSLKLCDWWDRAACRVSVLVC